jgi:hypothetical protein
MYQHVTKMMFCDEFKNSNRADNYSYEGLTALFDMFDEDNIELDVIAICCDWTEDTEENIRKGYALDDEQTVLDYLERNTTVIELDNGSFLYANF